MNIKIITQWFLFSLFYAIIPVYAQPVLTISEFNTKQTKSSDYNVLIHDNLTALYTSKHGTHAIYAVHSKTDPNKQYVFHIFSDPVAYQNNIQNPSYITYIQTLSQITNPPQTFKQTNPIFLSEKPESLYKLGATKLPIIRLAEIIVKPQENAYFQQIVVAEMQDSIKKEKGVLAIYAVTENSQHNHWYFIEIYADEAAYQSHRNTSHFKQYIQQTTTLIVSKKLNKLNNQILISKGGLSFLTPH